MSDARATRRESTPRLRASLLLRVLGACPVLRHGALLAALASVGCTPLVSLGGDLSTTSTAEEGESTQDPEGSESGEASEGESDEAAQGTGLATSTTGSTGENTSGTTTESTGGEATTGSAETSEDVTSDDSTSMSSEGSDSSTMEGTTEPACFLPFVMPCEACLRIWCCADFLRCNDDPGCRCALGCQYSPDDAESCERAYNCPDGARQEAMRACSEQFCQQDCAG